VRLPGAGVLDEPIERMPVIGDLLHAVAAVDGPELGRRDARCPLGRAARGDRRPGRRTRTETCALVSLVPLKQVERATAAVGEYLAELGVRGLDLRRRVRRRRCRGGASCSAAGDRGDGDGAGDSRGAEEGKERLISAPCGLVWACCPWRSCPPACRLSSARGDSSAYHLRRRETRRLLAWLRCRQPGPPGLARRQSGCRFGLG
jgi:hypothetical protein